jgi:hypothetical protein
MRIAVAAICLALPLVAAAQPQPRDRAADAIDWDKDKDKPESEATLPPPPQPQNLIRYDPGRPSSLRFYVDAASASVAEEGMVRFTSVARGDGSSANVTFEAIRCTTREYKIYAYGKPDGTWSPARDPQWKSIRTVQLDGHRATLYQDYFCPSRSGVTSAAEAVEAVRRGGHPKSGDFNANAPMPR